MDLRLWTLALLLLFLTLTSVCGGPLAESSDGNVPEEDGIRNLVHPKGVRNGAGHRQGHWRKYRRQRPRLSHKGPMPF
ncbi:apelin [Microcaecilia unicolor]|uniref:Apelin n=1 Tax=Microcaecilia unicolor TaxID=1415580 RepID=A0A6P7YN13_9AMPH|nr:apelin [Microcaecilia unicolor]